MNIKLAAMETSEVLLYSDLPYEDPEYGRDHLLWMASMITSGKVSGEKAHRWLGYIQGCLCARNCSTVEEMKDINRR